jgi:dsRNA-specific ribonuclease
MQDTVEAIIGAAYIDGGEVVARKVMVVLGLE